MSAAALLGQNLVPLDKLIIHNNGEAVLGFQSSEFLFPPSLRILGQHDEMIGGAQIP